MMDKETRMKALDAALTQIEKAYGKGAVMKLGDPANTMNVETVPTGSLSLDLALGLGGEGTARLYALLGLCCGAAVYCLGPRAAWKTIKTWGRRKK